MKTKSKKIIISVIIVTVALVIGSIVTYAAVSKSTGSKYKDKQSGFKTFSYTLKGDYKSRDDVLEEKENLARAYKSNIDGCSPEYQEKTMADFYELYNQLDDELNKFPQKKVNKNDKRKEEIYGRLEFLKGIVAQDDFESSKALYEKAATIISKYESSEYTLYEAYEQMMAVKLPSYDNLYDEYKFCEEKYYENEKKGYTKELYETASDIMEKHKNGELTLEQACDRMDYLKYPADGMLLTNIIYEQKEKEQGNPTYF